MNNSDIRFKGEFYTATAELSLTDMIATAYDSLLSGYNETYANVVGIYKVQSPMGVIYGGTEFNNNDFSSPDTNGATPTWAKNEISLPVSGSEILCGNYTFSYKTRLTLVNTLTGYANGYFTVTGENYEQLLGTNPTNIKIQIYSAGTPTGNEGTYELTSVTDNSGDTRFYCSGVTPFTADADDRIGIIFETSKTFNYCHDVIHPKLTATSSCIFSTLTCEDRAEYYCLFSDYGTKTPTITRSWRLFTPAGYSTNIITTGNVNPFTIGHGTSVNSGANIWTGDYEFEQTINLTYNVDLWDLATWIVVHDTMVDTHTHKVKCDTCFCDIKQCIENMFNKYKYLQNKKPSEALNLGTRLFSIMASWMLYGMNERCGTDYTHWCNEIKELVLEHDCQCGESDDTISKEVIPLALQMNNVGSVTGSQITFGTGGDGLPTNPAEGDTHIFNSTTGNFNEYDVYWYNGTSWEFQFNIKGVQGDVGSTGTTGATGATGASGTTVLFDKTLDTPTSITATTYTQFTDMITSALTSLSALGDKYEIKATFETSTIGKLSPDYAKIKIDGQDLHLTYIIPSMVLEHQFVGMVKSISINATATVIDVATKKIQVKYDITHYDTWANEMYHGSIFSLITVSDLASIVIGAYGRVGSVGSVACKQLSVTFYKK